MTIEVFLKWKAEFDAERLALREKKEKAAKAAKEGKLTGKQLFITDNSLIDSDVKFLEAGKLFFFYSNFLIFTVLLWIWWS